MVRPLVAVLLLAPAALGQTVHRYGFEPKDRRTTSFAAGDTNVTVKELAHNISDEFSKSAPTSEHVKIDGTPPQDATQALFAHYFYETPQAPVTDRLVARVYARSFKPGVQAKVRVVLPRERDPANPAQPLTVLVPGDTYTRPYQWQALGFGNIEDGLKRQLPVLLARLGRAVDPTDAYVDRIVVNVYTGPGVSEVWLDDVEIGPVTADAPPPRQQGTLTGRDATERRGLGVELSNGQILVQSPEDGKLRPFFPLIGRYTETDPAFLHRLRAARLNAMMVPPDAPSGVLNEIANQGFWTIPTLPLPAAEWKDGKPRRPDAAELDREAEVVANTLRKFLAGDSVLMWDMGSGRVAEDLGRASRVTDLLRKVDPRRPRSVGLWDGFGAFSSYATAVEFHREPLFSSLEFGQYRDWLDQKKELVGPGRLTWGWVQNHVPDWFADRVGTCPGLPTGPHPEQIRALTYLHLAAGHRGLGFWSDRAAYFPDVLPTDGCHGRDLYLEMWLLTAEIEMLAPVLAAAPDRAVWVGTSDPNVHAGIVRGANDILVIPVWLGGASQHVPNQATVPYLTVTVPGVPERAIPWLITPAGVREIKAVSREAGGSKVSIPDFDTACAVVFTTDLDPRGKTVRWQDVRHRTARQAAEVAHKLAIDQFNKVCATHKAIVAAGGPELFDVGELLSRSDALIKESKLYYDLNEFDRAYAKAQEARRPLRVIITSDWFNAVKTLDTPTASPYAASFFTLPLHWPFAREVQASRPAGNALPNGGFELSREAPEGGARVDSLPGWKTRTLILDKADGLASIVNVTDGLKDKPPTPPTIATVRTNAARVGVIPLDFRQPQFGCHCLKLEISPRPKKDAAGNRTIPPQAVERTVVAVDSPEVELPPGQLVRVSFWVKSEFVEGSADGLVAFDSAGGEPLGVRIRAAGGWRQVKLYRRVPASGRLSLSFVLTGYGTAYIEDVAVEPLVGGAVVTAGG